MIVSDFGSLEGIFRHGRKAPQLRASLALEVFKLKWERNSAGQNHDQT